MFLVFFCYAKNWADTKSSQQNATEREGAGIGKSVNKRSGLQKQEHEEHQRHRTQRHVQQVCIDIYSNWGVNRWNDLIPDGVIGNCLKDRWRICT